MNKDPQTWWHDQKSFQSLELIKVNLNLSRLKPSKAIQNRKKPSEIH